MDEDDYSNWTVVVGRMLFLMIRRSRRRMSSGVVVTTTSPPPPPLLLIIIVEPKARLLNRVERSDTSTREAKPTELVDDCNDGGGVIDDIATEP